MAIEKLQAYKTGQIDLEIDVVEFAVNRHVSRPKDHAFKEVSLFDCKFKLSKNGLKEAL